MSNDKSSNNPSPTSPKSEEAETKQEQKNVTSTKPDSQNQAADNNEKPADLKPDAEQKAAGTASEQTEPEGKEAEQDPVEALKTENADLKDKMLRLNADMENLRRRTEREKQDMAKYAITAFARDLLTLDDNLNRALSAVPEGQADNDPALKALVEGMEMTGRELTNVFERNGITRLSPEGESFDPNCHQAMYEIPNTDVPAGTIMEVVAAGFMIDKRVLRPAMVGVSKGGEKPKKPSAEEKPKEATSEQTEE